MLRLLTHCIHPIFVFDGPNKPAFKRNKRSGRGDGVATSMAKRLIRLFGFRIHDAPGEAEAECALLQQKGIVDAVLSEDVDTIMFGCTRTLRNWTAEGSGSAKTPTHVSMHDTDMIRRAGSGLDREGMVLVALVSGGDYLPEGVPGAGVKLACEAARAGFGASLCRLKRSDTAGLAGWRENLIHELRTNESAFFRTKHKALKVPDDFPSLEVLRYYTHPVVSPASVLERLQSQTWEGSIDVLGLRQFVRETFDWEYRGGAIKFIRVLAPGLLVRKMMDRSQRQEELPEDAESLERQESELVRSITTRRTHSSTDLTPELRISFIPTEIVGYNFEEEPEEEILASRDGLALNSDDESENVVDEGKSGPKKPFNPNDPDLLWISETVAKLGIPVKVGDWEEAQRIKASRKGTKAAKAPKPKAGVTQAGALDKFVKVTKKGSTSSAGLGPTTLAKPVSSARSRSSASPRPANPPKTSRSLPTTAPSSPKPQLPKPQSRGKQPSKSEKTGHPVPQLDSSANPWTMTSSHSATSGVSRRSATVACATEAILISSSPPASPIASSSCVAPARGPLRRAMSPASTARVPVDSVSRAPKRKSAPPSADVHPRGYSPSRGPSPIRDPTARPRKKLARTGSMPVSPDSLETHREGPRERQGRLARARTVAVEHPERLSDGEESDMDLPPLGDFAGRLSGGSNAEKGALLPLAAVVVCLSDGEGSDPDLPPLDNLTGRASGGPDLRPVASSPSPSPSVSVSVSVSVPEAPQAVAATGTGAGAGAGVPRRKDGGPGQKHQGKLGEAFGMRTTKMYVPRQSLPGFFKEVEVSADEAAQWTAAAGSRDKGRSWRRSDISLIDLTGEDS